MTQTRVTRHIRAPRGSVYRALLDADAVAAWRAPEGMTAIVHSFDARVGGHFRVSLTYESPDGRGKTADRTDTYHGRFVELVLDERVVEEIEFETSDPAANGDTTVVVHHDGIPSGVSPQDNEIGTEMALDKLAALVERDPL
ncbi:SRPBCC domain-containing protein [Mycobacterium nebraskense]|uniref:SRPBCC domain-containing protein n=1 Tax=Mycobacterium nebraskense TaxID=244292 RepID=UPI0021F317A5|nr:SRPBCC domain-containing protein [Mycobacterium nebraskense]MCV7117498.1 SRPBCC domain-containing protein [Mycobacterium nebraskense]